MSKRKPVIGITPSTDANGDPKLRMTYLNAVLTAGGLPVIFPFANKPEDIARLVEMCDGILFSGGVDLDPVLFNEKKLNDTVKICEPRDRMEIPLARIALKADKPILAICRGIQTIDVAFGGALYQDLPAQLNLSHHQTGAYPKDGHDVKIKPGTPFAKLMRKRKIRANTYHHQSVKTLGAGFEIMALSDDGVIEAIYMPSKKHVIGVQWHPELIWKHAPEHKLVFDNFIACCRKENPSRPAHHSRV